MRAPAQTEPTIRVVLLPRDTNQYGTIFGGVILSYLDQAGLVEARKNAAKNFVTVAMREVEFVAPVYVGDLVSFYTRTLKIGRTSVTVEILVEAQRCQSPQTTVRVTQAQVTYVAVNKQRKPIPVRPKKIAAVDRSGNRAKRRGSTPPSP